MRLPTQKFLLRWVFVTFGILLFFISVGGAILLFESLPRSTRLLVGMVSIAVFYAWLIVFSWSQEDKLFVRTDKVKRPDPNVTPSLRSDRK